MDSSLYKEEAKEKMQGIISAFQRNIAKISAGRANPQVLEAVKVNYYETLTPLSQVATISVPEARQMVIKPFDPNINKEIVAKINSAELGFNAKDEGDKARVIIPEMTTERRTQLAKDVKRFTEQAKVQVRAIRHDVNTKVKKDQDLSEDHQKNHLDEIQKVTDDYVKQIDKITLDKQQDLMSI